MSSEETSSGWTHAQMSTIAGGGAGIVSSVCTVPLDVIKTKLQAQTASKGSPSYLGITGTVKAVLHRDGLKGLYRGLGPTVMGYIPTWAIYFSMYDGIKTHFGDDQWSRKKDSSHGDHHSIRESMLLHVGAAMAAGATSTIVTNPIWVIKTRFMTQPANEIRYRHTLDAFATVYRREGLSPFYRGLVPSLFGVTHVAVQFPLYEELKVWFAERQKVPVTSLNSGTVLICSAISKMIASLVTYPHEVIRTRLQLQPSPPPSQSSSGPSRQHHHHPLSFRSIIITTKLVVEESGWRGLYRGLSINLLRTVPNAGVTLLTYELLMRQLSGRDKDRP